MSLRRLYLSFPLFLFWSNVNNSIVIRAQSLSTPAGVCATQCALEHASLYTAIFNSTDSGIPQAWCPFWADYCPCFDRRCAGDVVCRYSNTSEGCVVEADLYATFLVAGALVPLAALPSTGPLLPTAVGTGAPDATTTSSSTTTIISDPLPTLPNPPPATTSQHLPLENDGAKAFFTSLIALMIAFNIAGSLFNAKNAISGASPDLSTAVVAGTSRLSYCSALYPGSLAGTPLSINSLLQSALECIKAVDPFFLLFHFQFTSFSGMFSLAYPPQYQGFTYNFLFANLFVPIPSFEQSQVAGRGLCWGMIDPEAVRKYGFFSLAGRFGVAVYALGGIVYLCILCALAILIALGVIIWLILWVIEMWWKRRARKCNLGHRSYAVYRELRQRWPAIAYDLLLRLFHWILGSVAAFAFFQFTQPQCGPAPLGVALFEFFAILSTLIATSILIVRVARGIDGGIDALFAKDSPPLPSSGESKKLPSTASRLVPVPIPSSHGCDDNGTETESTSPGHLMPLTPDLERSSSTPTTAGSCSKGSPISSDNSESPSAIFKEDSTTAHSTVMPAPLTPNRRRTTHGVDVIHSAARPEPHDIQELQSGKYYRRWGSLYSAFQRRYYWFFILEFMSTLLRSAITGFGQGHGVAQVCAGLCLELVCWGVLLAVRPYETRGENILNIVAASQRLLTLAMFPGFIIGANTDQKAKESVGILLITLSLCYGAVLVALMVAKVGFWMVDWVNRRKRTRVC